MGKWTLIDTLKQRVWLQNVLVFAPLVLILLYIGFFILDFVNIVGVIEYNNDVLSIADTNYIYGVDVTTAGDKYYLHLKDIDLDGANKLGYKSIFDICSYFLYGFGTATYLLPSY